MGDSGLSFVSNYNAIDFSLVADDAALLTKVQTGQAGTNTGPGNIIAVAPIFGGTTPETVTQDSFTGQNDLKKALAASMGLIYERKDFTLLDVNQYELKLDDAAIEFNKDSKHVNVYLFSGGAL